jgi:membrane-bound lytic murein transglycosylase D
MVDNPESAVVDELEKLDLIPISIDPALQDVVEADLASTKYDIPITLNERVLKSLNYWVSKGRQLFIDGLVRSGRYRDIIEKAFRDQSIPLDVMYLAQVESLFKTNAVSTQAARGIWQFGKATALNYGLKVNSYIDERSDPEKSTVAAARYLNDLYAMFKDWTLVLAAYNCGEGRIQKLMDRSGLNSFWELVDLRQNLPPETQNHVPLVMASIILAHNPEKYGLPKELAPRLAYAKISVPRPIDLRMAAKLLKMSIDRLRQLNPAIKGFSTPPSYPQFMLNVPVSVTRETRQKIAALPTVTIRPQAELTARYKIISGDTLDKISHHYGVSVSALRNANNIKSPNTLRTGSWIKIPGTRSTGKSSTGARSSQTKTLPRSSALSKPAPSVTPKSSTKGALSTKGNGGPTSRPTRLTTSPPKRPATPLKPSTGIHLTTPKKTTPKEIATR